MDTWWKVEGYRNLSSAINKLTFKISWFKLKTCVIITLGIRKQHSSNSKDHDSYCSPTTSLDSIGLQSYCHAGSRTLVFTPGDIGCRLTIYLSTDVINIKVAIWQSQIYKIYWMTSRLVVKNKLIIEIHSTVDSI